jgi:hypothetical protein
MLVIRWLVVWEQGAEDKTIISIFPAARHIQAPYPVHCKVTLVSHEANLTPPLTLEGPKVNQPSQLVLEEVFPFQDSSPKLRGVLVELLPTRWSLDLSLSRCLIERISRDKVLHYAPTPLPSIAKPGRPDKVQINTDLSFNRLPSYPIIKSSSTATSIVTINNTDSIVSVNLGLKGLEAKGGTQLNPNEDSRMDQNLAINIPPHACYETALYTKHTKSAIALGKVDSDDTAVYILERNSQTTEIESISAL